MGALTFVGDVKVVQILVFGGVPVEALPELHRDVRVADVLPREVGVGLALDDPLHVLAHLDLVERPVSRALVCVRAQVA